jgi:type IV fimbrial biogenesis protein FimT
MRIRNNSGFSLGELITVMGILTVMATIAIPNLVSWRGKAQLGRAAQDMYSTFQRAKIEAARRNVTVAITRAGNIFTVYVDSDGDFIQDGGEDVINTINLAQYPGVSLDSLSFTNPVNGIAFAPNGFPINNLNALASGDLVLKNKANKKNRVSITKAGNISINKLG